MKTASDVKDTSRNNPDRAGSNAPDAKTKAGSWQFSFVMGAIALGLLVLLGKAFGLY